MVTLTKDSVMTKLYFFYSTLIKLIKQQSIPDYVSIDDKILLLFFSNLKLKA